MCSKTLLYMLLQRAGTGTIPPPDFSPPHWESLAAQWQAAPKPAVPTVEIGPVTVTLGVDDTEAEDNDPVKRYDFAGHVFGWDNESPSRQAEVKAFRIDWRPVTNGEFYEFYKGVAHGKVKFPASWEDRGGDICVSLFSATFPILAISTFLQRCGRCMVLCPSRSLGSGRSLRATTISQYMPASKVGASQLS